MNYKGQTMNHRAPQGSLLGHLHLPMSVNVNDIYVSYYVVHVYLILSGVWMNYYCTVYNFKCGIKKIDGRPWKVHNLRPPPPTKKQKEKKLDWVSVNKSPPTKHIDPHRCWTHGIDTWPSCYRIKVIRGQGYDCVGEVTRQTSCVLRVLCEGKYHKHVATESQTTCLCNSERLLVEGHCGRSLPRSLPRSCTDVRSFGR